jgi:tetratricopeptide (TPR) repeat protein
MIKNTRTLQVVVVACSVILFVLLFIANKKPVKKAEDAASKTEVIQQIVDIKVIVDAIISSLPPADKKEYDALDKKTTDTTGLNAMVDFFNTKKIPVASCYYYQKKAEKVNTAKIWYDAGSRYFYSVGFVKDKNQVQSLYQSAMNCYTKALDKKPDYTDAKIQLGSCYVEGSSDPMKGIGMLKEVERADSANIQVQMVLGAFAVKSGQFDKAEARYKKVIRIKPEYLEAYLFLADVYEKEGEKNKTIETLERYVELTPDKEIKEQIKKYIVQLKSNV